MSLAPKVIKRIESEWYFLKQPQQPAKIINP
jgi:hypothetical protein